LNAVQRTVAVLLASGFTRQEVARKMRVSERTITAYRQRPDVADFIKAKEKEGVTELDVLNALLYSGSETIRLRAAQTLAKLRAEGSLQGDDTHVGPRIEIYGHPDEAPDA
jgi:hypothetical protein